MQSSRLVLFAYNFPHKKTQDFLYRLHAEGYEISTIIACDPIELNIPPSTIRTKLRHIQSLHPRQVAESLGIEYMVLPHNDPRTVDLLKSTQPDLGIISGARILKRPVIEQFKTGIINFHPGLIPEARGLDAMLWSIHQNIPLGVTSHLIDERIDAGGILIKQPIRLYLDDTLLDLSERLYETQIEMIKPSIQAAQDGTNTPVPAGTTYNRKMPADLEATIPQMLSAYLRRMI